MNKTTTSQNKRNSRRSLLGALTIGAATAKLPELWAQPVVESVLLPAHAVATNEVLRSAGGGGDIVSGSVSPLLDGLVPRAHAVGSPYPGCASFSWIVNTINNAVLSVTLDLLAKECESHSDLYQVLANTPMTKTDVNKYEANGNDHTVVFFLTDPLASTGKVGTCEVNSHNPFDVFLGETCTAEHPDEPSCAICKEVNP